MNGSPTPILDRIEKRRRDEAKVIPFPRPNRKPRWIERLQDKDTTDWWPKDAA